jgi:hypothetical protein
VSLVFIRDKDDQMLPSGGCRVRTVDEVRLRPDLLLDRNKVKPAA